MLTIEEVEYAGLYLKFTESLSFLSNEAKIFKLF